MAKKKGKLRHIHIEANTDGTAQIKVHRSAPPMETSEKGNPMMDYDSNDESMSGTPEEAGAHVTRVLKQHFGQQSDDDSDDAAPMRGAFGRKKKY